MSDTIVDMPKVTQMLDAGWRVVAFKNGIGTYTVGAVHPNTSCVENVRSKLIARMRENKNFLELINTGNHAYFVTAEERARF